MTSDDAVSENDAVTSDDAAMPEGSADDAVTDAGPEDPFASAAGMRVLRGTPDDEELAALVAGVAAYASTAHSGDDDPGSPTSEWMDRIRTMRGRRVIGPLGRGPSSWRHSLR